jgi:hypothetical protein
MRFGFSTAATRSGVIGAARAAVDNPQPVGIPLKKPFRTVLTSGATSEAKSYGALEPACLRLTSQYTVPC